MPVLTAEEVHSRVQHEAKEKNVQALRTVLEILVGKVVRQGDIYIHRVQESHAHGKELKSRQLALGNTQGSRHMAEEPAQVFEGIKLPEWCAAGTFLGPLVKSKKAFKVGHPEHAHVILPAGTYQITHQMDARTLQRVRD